MSVVNTGVDAVPRTLEPSSCAMPSASAVLPVPGAPAMSSARPAIFFCLIMSTTTPHASRACSCPTQPADMSIASPSSFRPRPCGEERERTEGRRDVSERTRGSDRRWWRAKSQKVVILADGCPISRREI